MLFLRAAHNYVWAKTLGWNAKASGGQLLAVALGLPGPRKKRNRRWREVGAVGATELGRFKEELAEVLTGPFEGHTDWTAQELGELLNSLARDFISPAELAETLREGHWMNKAALLNRAKELVKVAIQKGRWV